MKKITNVMKNNSFIAAAIILSVAVTVAVCRDDWVTLDGSQYVQMSLMASPMHENELTIAILFKTDQETGLLFYAGGTVGDFIALELYHGRIRYSANSEGYYATTHVTTYHDGYFADGKMYQVNVEVGETTKIYTQSTDGNDPGVTTVKSTAHDLRFDLDETAYFLGVPPDRRTENGDVLKTGRNFRGCANVVMLTSGQSSNREVAFPPKNLTTGVGVTGDFSRTGCHLSNTTFLKTLNDVRDTLRIDTYDTHELHVELAYKTYARNGVLITNTNAATAYPSVVLQLFGNKLELKANLSRHLSFSLTHEDRNNDDGSWHSIAVKITNSAVELSMDQNSVSKSFQSAALSFSPIYTLGRSLAGDSLIGCVKNVKLSGKSVNKFLSDDALYINAKCRLQDMCYENNPCSNRGRCFQTSKDVACDCMGTGFMGDTCDIKSTDNFQQSCASYYNSGYAHSGLYTIRPGLAMPFKAICKMNAKKQFTLVETTVKNESNVFVRENWKLAEQQRFVYHQVSYKASKRQMRELIEASSGCRQYVRYNCYESTLTGGSDASDLGIRWYSRKGSLKDNWGAADGKSNHCTCADKNKCASSNGKCNCDVMDKRLRFDDGYVTNKDDLPITKIRVSIEQTSHRSSFVVGPLECFDVIKSSKTPDKLPTTKTPVITSPITAPSPTFSEVTPAINPTPKVVRWKNETALPSNNKKNEKTVIVISSEMVYLLIVGAVVLVIFVALLFLVKRRCCRSRYSKPLPQIVEIYKDEPYTNNNIRSVEVTNDITVKVDNTVRQHQASPQTSEHSGYADATRYFHPESSSDDTSSLHDTPPHKRDALRLNKQSIVRSSSARSSRRTKDAVNYSLDLTVPPRYNKNKIYFSSCEPSSSSIPGSLVSYRVEDTSQHDSPRTVDRFDNKHEEERLRLLKDELCTKTLV